MCSHVLGALNVRGPSVISARWADEGPLGPVRPQMEGGGGWSGGPSPRVVFSKKAFFFSTWLPSLQHKCIH